ncbi:HTH domain-containing protein [Listeria sp. PSOL-1]|uniref:HTH domain-containing protein n=1 Tax=Listeria sp. PSOL-1 TaxID=1844999 RepID=UPI0013D85CE4|nr:HTH domain-containing protein [Listeria sp. PSOL-1]
MLNERQIKILDLLRGNFFLGEELSEFLHVSRRTIVRDIIMIDFWLKEEKIGYIERSRGYKLNIINQRLLNKFLLKLEADERTLLFELLTHAALSISEIQEKLYLSKKEIMNIIKNSNEKYLNYFQITSKSNKGIFINESSYKKLDILSSLLVSSGENLVVDEASIYEEPWMRYMTSKQKRAQWLACQTATKYHSYMIEKAACCKQLLTIDLSPILRKINQTYNLVYQENKLLEQIKNHLLRNLAFPNYFDGKASEQIRILKSKNPFSFDFSTAFVQQISLYFKDVYIDPDYLALYVINEESMASNETIHVLMAEDKYSIGSINSMMLTEQIEGIEVDVVHTMEEVKNALKNTTYDLTIGEKEFMLTEAFRFDYQYDGLFSSTDLSNIRKRIEQVTIRNHLKENFKEETFYCLEAENKGFIEALNAGMDYFVRKQLLSVKEAEQIKLREIAGNQLVVNHVSMPHISTQLNHHSQFRLLYIHLKAAVSLNDELIYGILIVLVDQNATSYSQIFSYLYNHLKENDIRSCESYEQILALLE